MIGRREIRVTVESEECVVHESEFVENGDGTVSFDARVIVQLSDGTRRWTANKVIRCRAERDAKGDE